MPNKHQTQKDFYTKMSEWKENYKVNTGTQNEENKKEEHQKLIFSENCYNGIEGARKITKEELETPEYKALAEETNKKIEEERRRKVKTLEDAKNYIFR